MKGLLNLVISIALATAPQAIAARELSEIVSEGKLKVAVKDDVRLIINCFYVLWALPIELVTW